MCTESTFMDHVTFILTNTDFLAGISRIFLAIAAVILSVGMLRLVRAFHTIAFMVIDAIKKSKEKE